MRFTAATARGVRHAAGALAEAALIVAIVGAFAFGVGTVAGDPAGARTVDAAPKVKATMLASPTTLAVGDMLHLTGAGLDPAGAAWVRTTTATTLGWYNLRVEADGTYAIDLTFSQAGSVKVDIYQVVHNRSVLMSSCAVTVLE